MGIIDDKRKFKRKVKQNKPTNPSENTNLDNKKFDFNADTIKEQQSKK